MRSQLIELRRKKWESEVELQALKTGAPGGAGTDKNVPLPQPTNDEIEAALAERNRIFGADQHASLVKRLRSIAVHVMYELQPFRPCLVGAVLSGNVTQHSTIDLHVFSDASESVGLRLDARGIQHHLTQRRHRLRRDHVEDFPGYEFWADEWAVEATVFPERRKGHAPLSPVDGRPMARARLREVETMLG